MPSNTIPKSIGNNFSENQPDIFDAMEEAVEKKVSSPIEIPKELEKIKGLEKLAPYIEEYKKTDLEIQHIKAEKESLEKKRKVLENEGSPVADKVAYRPGESDLVRRRASEHLKKEREKKEYEIAENKLAYDVADLKLAGVQERAEAYEEDAKLGLRKILDSIAGKDLEEEKNKVILLNDYLSEITKPSEIGHSLGNICARRLLALHQEQKRQKEELARLEAERLRIEKERQLQEAEEKRKQEELAEIRKKAHENSLLNKTTQPAEPFHSSLKNERIEKADIKASPQYLTSDEVENNAVAEQPQVEVDQNFEISSIEPTGAVSSVTEDDGLVESNQGAGVSIDKEATPGEFTQDLPIESENDNGGDLKKEELNSENVLTTPEQEEKKEVQEEVLEDENASPKIADIEKKTDEGQTLGIIQEEESTEDSPKKKKRQAGIAMSELYNGVIKSLDKGNPEDLAKFIKALEKVKADASAFGKN